VIDSLLFLVTLSLIWGSFLNVVAYRLIHNKSIVTPRSFCPHCKKTIAWYDNIPVLSWLLLRAKCRNCKNPISFLYPFIELLTAASFTSLYYFEPTYFPAYAFFFSALIVIIRTDLEYMLISRASTLWLIPCAYALSYLNMLPLTLQESVIGSIVGYLTLFLVAHIFYLITKKQGMGEGDFDLLALIGAFVGLQGIFITLLIGSWIGTIAGIAYIFIGGKNLQVKIPFGPFLAFGAMSYVLWHDAIEQIISYLQY
jgi:leader peptidase (prepilin peptidase)/N-methyltransferase